MVAETIEQAGHTVNAYSESFQMKGPWPGTAMTGHAWIDDHGDHINVHITAGEYSPEEFAKLREVIDAVPIIA